jgi:hypothetical protein
MLEIIGAPYGNRTHVSAVKGRRPGPLDEGRGPRAYGAVERARHIKGFGGAGKQQETDVAVGGLIGSSPRIRKRENVLP